MILDGKKIKNIILDEIKDEVSQMSTKLKLVVIQVGDDTASNVYIKQKINMCNYVGYDCEHIKLDDVDTDYLINLINNLNNDNNVTGILVQLPLPDNIDKDRVLNLISYLKDVDGLTDINRNRLINGDEGLFPCTPLGVMELFSRYDISVNGKNVVIVGRSNLVGKPLEIMIKDSGANVMVCHSKTDDLSKYTREADIIISAVGKPKLITNDMISEDVVLIDVGITKVNDVICGDVDYESVKEKCSYITPVPGGIGPMTIAMLAKNILKAYKMKDTGNFNY